MKHLNRTYGSKVTTILKFHSLPMSPKLLTQYQVMSLDFGLTNYPKKCILYIMFVSITVSATCWLLLVPFLSVGLLNFRSKKKIGRYHRSPSKEKI